MTRLKPGFFVVSTMRLENLRVSIANGRFGVAKALAGVYSEKA